MSKEKIYYYTIECEHDGDVSRECRNLTDGGGSEVVEVETEGEGCDRDYHATIYFKITDEEKFKENTGYSVDDFCEATWM